MNESIISAGNRPRKNGILKLWKILNVEFWCKTWLWKQLKSFAEKKKLTVEKLTSETTFLLSKRTIVGTGIEANKWNYTEADVISFCYKQTWKINMHGSDPYSVIESEMLGWVNDIWIDKWIQMIACVTNGFINPILFFKSADCCANGSNRFLSWIV